MGSPHVRPVSYGVFMNRLQFWEWGLWPWLGDVIASQPFLTLMVPVATLTGVVITTKSNERIRRREHPPAGWAELDSLVWLMAPSRLIVFLITGRRALPTIRKMGNSIRQVKIYATVLPAA